jgi:hypothetical protein
MNLVTEFWPWYVSGPLIGIIMLLLLYWGKSFGISSTFRQVCSISGAGRHIPFFDYHWKQDSWNLIFVIGIVLGGFISYQWLGADGPAHISDSTVKDLRALGVLDFNGMLPDGYFSWHALGTLPGFILIVIGGFLVGFGARWAGGCTSGHAISGLSNLQLPSLVVVIGFFIGGLLMTHLIFPYIFSINP